VSTAPAIPFAAPAAGTTPHCKRDQLSRAGQRLRCPQVALAVLGARCWPPAIARAEHAPGRGNSTHSAPITAAKRDESRSPHDPGHGTVPNYGKLDPGATEKVE